MAFEPVAGQVVRYDFLWKEQQKAGVESCKDRPCAIVLATAELPDGSRDVLLCAITHSPPAPGEAAVAVPPAVARHLGLDGGQSWIKTSQVNVINWQKGRIPYGVIPVRADQWIYGMLPQSLGKQAFEQVRDKARTHSLRTVDRNE